MKKKLMKFLKWFTAVIAIVLVVFFTALLWPMPELEPPAKHSSILIRSVNIVDVKTGNVLMNQDVLIRDNKIVAIDSLGLLEPELNSITIDGSNKYLIPGLWDMHTHSNQHSPWLHHPLYIANGVTGIRDMSGQLDQRDSYWVGSTERLQWEAEMNAYTRVAPRHVLQSSYQIDGPASVPEGFPEFFQLSSPSQVDSLLQFYADEKVDFIKVYQQIPVESYLKLAERAERYGLHLAGHKPMFVDLATAVRLGQRSFEHGRIFFFESFPDAELLRDTLNWKQNFSSSKRRILEEFDPEIAKSLMELMKTERAYWVPTLQTLKFEAYAHQEAFKDNPNLQYISRIRKSLWWNYDTNKNAERNTEGPSKGLSEGFYKSLLQQVNMANELGVPIMAGTDVTDSYTFAGFSLHQELIDLNTAGLSPLEALQSATLVPAQYVNKQGLYGSVEIGKMADLVLLNKNPLEDISNTSNIYGVIANGLYYDTEKLEQLKEFSESAASSFHINVKVFYGLIGSPLIRVQFAD